MQSTPSQQRVVVVLVAYNRRDLLIEALDALGRQTVPPVAIVVVDNASTDDTASVALASESPVDLVRLERNTGGAGGFAAGMAIALQRHRPDWLWMMDDDTIPTATALAELLAAVEATDVVVAGSRVEWVDGSEHPMNTPREKPFVSRTERAAARQRNSIPVRSTSFVSMLVRADAVRAKGLPITDYFIWNDDFEYSTRVLRRHRGIHVPASVVIHKTKALGSTDVDPGSRFYYEVRNKVWMLGRSRGLNPVEKALYGASSVRRWIRAFRASSDRELLRDGLRRGLRDGFRSKPRSNAEALAGLGDVTLAVSEAEAIHG